MGQRNLMSKLPTVYVFMKDESKLLGGSAEWLGDTPFKDKPTEGFICPCRGAQSLLKKLHFLLQALWTEIHAGIETISLISKVKSYLMDLPYRDLFIGIGQIILQRLHILFGTRQLH